MKQNLCIQISDEIGQSAKNLFDNYDSMLFEFQINFWSTFPKESVRREQVRRAWQNARHGHRDVFHVTLNFTQEVIFRKFFFHTGYFQNIFIDPIVSARKKAEKRDRHEKREKERKRRFGVNAII